MDNWITTLKTARSAMTKLQAMSEEPNAQQPLQVRLLRDLHHISVQQGGTKILFNVQMAAIGLYFILQGYRSTNDLVCNSEHVG